MSMMCLDFSRDSRSSLEVLDELIPKISSLTLVAYVYNKLQDRHARVNLIPLGVCTINYNIKYVQMLMVN
jgi:glycine cleavage system protein P-like pyridoxal-binding family